MIEAANLWTQFTASKHILNFGDFAFDLAF